MCVRACAHAHMHVPVFLICACHFKMYESINTRKNRLFRRWDWVAPVQACVVLFYTLGYIKGPSLFLRTIVTKHFRDDEGDQLIPVTVCCSVSSINFYHEQHFIVLHVLASEWYTVCKSILGRETDCCWCVMKTLHLYFWNLFKQFLLQKLQKGFYFNAVQHKLRQVMHVQHIQPAVALW